MPIFIFSHYKSMATKSCHSNLILSSYPVGTKNNIVRFPCLEMLFVKYGKNWLMASEEMSFENVDDDDRCQPIL